uniref:DUF7795 domain-containing protein n=1 Tax=Leersia perrieri TaxID=77586 RepID=A0A0D9XZS5_9ORYZ
MKSYLEAGCTHHNQNIQNMNQLHSCEEKLNDHMNKACLSSLRHTDDCPDDDNLTNGCSEDEQQPGDLLDRAVSCASVMVLVHNMLKLDYMMQGYCQMWDLRPYIDDNVMQLAWKLPLEAPKALEKMSFSTPC